MLKHMISLDNTGLQTLWQQLTESLLFLFQHDNTPVHKSSSIKTLFSSWMWEDLTGLPGDLTSSPILHLLR